MTEEERLTDQKEKARVRQRRYVEKNREKVYARNRAYQEANREEDLRRRREAARKRRSENPEKCSTINKAAYHNNKEKNKEKRHEQYLAKREEMGQSAYREHQKKLYYDRYAKKPWKYLHIRMKGRNKYRKNEYLLTEEWFKEHWTGKCEVTGIEFDLSDTGFDRFYSPSIDRIDNSLPYKSDNCRIVLDAFNMLKGRGTDEDVLRLVEAVNRNKDKLKIS